MNDQQVTKATIHEMFYSKQQVVRKGGGTLKTKMARNIVSEKQLAAMIAAINRTDNPKMRQNLMDYYLKQLNRKPHLGPPRHPSQK